MLAGLISGYADIALPLLAAIELFYLSVLATRPRFQQAVNAGGQTNTQPQGQLEQILATLNNKDLRHYQSLKNQCIKLHGLTSGSEVQLDGIKRLLWIFLKLLYAQNALETFFKTINVKDIEHDICHARERLDQLDTQSTRRRHLLTDTLTTSEQRLTNYRTAIGKYEFIKLELERLDTKINGMAELGINRQDHSLLSSEIDVIASSVTQTEKAIHELEFLADFSSDLSSDLSRDEPPAVLLL